MKFFSTPNVNPQLYMIHTYVGLGVRKSAHFNKACLAKLGLKVLTEDHNWWVQIVRNKYLKNEGFLNNKIRQNYSCAWKDILKTREVIKLRLRWVVENEEDIYFWTHNWIFPFPLTNLRYESQINSLDLELRVSHFIDNGNWNRHLLMSVVDAETVNKICSIPLPLISQRDCCC